MDTFLISRMTFVGERTNTLSHYLILFSDETRNIRHNKTQFSMDWFDWCFLVPGDHMDDLHLRSLQYVSVIDESFSEVL